jgi:fructose-bisphosphate aldolase class II
MMDGSLGEDGKTPTSYDYNVDVTKTVVDMAHACGVSVEGELGCLGSLETGQAGEEDGIGAEGTLDHSQLLTDPEEAADFVQDQGRRAGHRHRHLPRRLQVLIDEFGGAMGETYGVPVEEIAEGIKNGVRKVNIDTDLRMASTGAIRKHLAENPKNFDPRKYLAAATKAMKEICKDRYEAFGTAGNASKIQPLSLEAMTDRYTKGELDPKVN